MRDDDHSGKTPAERHDDRRREVCRAFGELINRLRRDRELTQEMLAERSGLTTDTVKELETGGFSPSLDTLGKLALGLDMRLSEILYGLEKSP